MEHRIGDPRIIRLIQKWLKAGVLEDGVVTVSDKGTGQGSVISPLLANVYLHYVFDLWADRWRRREATGDMIIVRYADDIIVGFEHEADARRFWIDARAVTGVSLSLHPEKTRLIEFGRFAATASGAGLANRRPSPSWASPSSAAKLAGEIPSNGSPDATACGRSSRHQGGMRRRMHQPIPEQGRWLKQVVTGSSLSRGADKRSTLCVPSTSPTYGDARSGGEARRIGRPGTDHAVGQRLAPQAAILHPWPMRALPSNTQGGSRCPNWARSDLCGGLSNGVPCTLRTA